MPLRLTLAAWFLMAATGQETPVIRASVNQVFVTFSATDANGLAVTDLKQGELQLKDDQRLREIQYFVRDVDVPLTIGLVVDMSGSQHKFFDRHRIDVAQFLRQILRPGDQAFLISLTGEVRLVTDLTGSVNQLLGGVNQLGKGRPGKLLGDQCRKKLCGSVIWTAMHSAAQLKLKGVPGRKALILLSDGMDAGSSHSVQDVIEAAQSVDAPVYTLTSQERSFALIPIRDAMGRSSMKKLAEETGGRSYKASPDKVAEIFREIEADLRSLYIAGFALPASERDGKFHKLELKATRAKVKLRARAGYTAEP
jgi:VWFA-related protein